MAVFPRGYIWPATGTLAAPPAAISLTAAYVASTFEFEVHEQSRLLCRATLAAGGVPDTALLVRVQYTLDGGTNWHNYRDIAIPLYDVGDHYFIIDLPHNWHSITWRVQARDMLADADTTCLIYAESMIHGGDRFYDDPGPQPIELENARINGVLAWHDGAGAADALGAGALAYGPAAGTQWVPVGRANEIDILFTTTGGPPTSVQFQIEESFDGGVTHPALPLINTVVGGIDYEMPMLIDYQSAAGTLANGTYQTRRIPVPPGSWIRMSAQRTGAAVNLLAYYRLYRSEV